MAKDAAVPSAVQSAVAASWLPMLVIALAQMQMSFNVNALPVSIGGIVDEFNTSPSSVSTALVVYSLAVAALVMLGAKLGKRLGSRLMFQVGVLAHGASMAMMALSTDADMMISAQAIAGIAAAVLVPSLVVMIATHYQGKQQSQALGYLQSSQAIAGVLAFLIAGLLATALGWRYSFALITLIAIVVFVLSFRLQRVPKQTDVRIDALGALLAAASIVLISFGFNNVNSWGLFVANPNAPFNLLGLSPAPLMIVVGIMFGQGFFTWSIARREKGQTPLLALEVLDTRTERAATYTLLVIGALGPAVNFLIPLYLQIVQGRTELQTAFAVIPYSLSIFLAAALSVRLFDRLTPKLLGVAGFIVVAAGLAFLAFVIQNDWGTPLVILGLIVTGLGEGMLLTLIFNVLVSTSPKELAGDVGALRGTVNNLSTAVGTAVAGALVIGILAVNVDRSLVDNQAIPPPLTAEFFSLNSVDFVSNDRLQEVLSATSATPEQVTAAIQINEETRLRSLKMTFLVLASLALLAVIPALWLPGKKLDDVRAEAAEAHEAAASSST